MAACRAIAPSVWDSADLGVSKKEVTSRRLLCAGCRSTAPCQPAEALGRIRDAYRCYDQQRGSSE